MKTPKRQGKDVRRTIIQHEWLVPPGKTSVTSQLFGSVVCCETPDRGSRIWRSKWRKAILEVNEQTQPVNNQRQLIKEWLQQLLRLQLARELGDVPSICDLKITIEVDQATAARILDLLQRSPRKQP